MKLITGASVTASGSGGIGLYAESTGGTTNGTIDVTVDSGATITASDDATAAISFVNGDSNTLTNNGTITTDDLTTSSIYALSSSGAALAVTNNGTFSGPVDFIPAMPTRLQTAAAPRSTSTTTFDLGSSGTFTNDGTVSPGGSGTVRPASSAGSFRAGERRHLSGRPRRQFDRRIDPRARKRIVTT